VNSSTYRSATTKCTGSQTNNWKLPTILLFLEFNTTVALAILRERDFVGAGVRQSCGCETAQGSVTPCSSADTAQDPNRPSMEEDKVGCCGNLY
jgi:hypothetical protein